MLLVLGGRRKGREEATSELIKAKIEIPGLAHLGTAELSQLSLDDSDFARLCAIMAKKRRISERKHNNSAPRRTVCWCGDLERRKDLSPPLTGLGATPPGSH